MQVSACIYSFSVNYVKLENRAPIFMKEKLFICLVITGMLQIPSTSVAQLKTTSFEQLDALVKREPRIDSLYPYFVV